MLTVCLHYGSVQSARRLRAAHTDPLQYDAGKRKHPGFGGAKDSDARDPLTRAQPRGLYFGLANTFEPPAAASDRKEPEW